MDLKFQPKYTDWVNEYENKISTRAVYKGPTSDLGIHIDWKWGVGNQKKAEVVILIWNKIDFKIKYVTRDKKGHYIRVKDLSNKKIQL